MAEVAYVGEEHRNTVLVGGGNHFVITDRTARLDYAGHARSGGGINTVAEREERVRSHRGTFHFQRSEEHTSELQSRFDLVCRLLLEKKKKHTSEDQSHIY